MMESQTVNPDSTFSLKSFLVSNKFRKLQKIMKLWDLLYNGLEQF